MGEPSPVIYVVDDDAAVRNALDSLIRSIGLEVRTFPSAPEFLATKTLDAPGCLVLDVRMPGVSGIDLQSELMKRGVDIPIIFVSAHGDVPMAVRAIKAGAAEFLVKPFREQELLDAIQRCVEQHRKARLQQAEISGLRQWYTSLTGRERHVFFFVVSGMLNKQIAARLGVSEKTIKIHRSNVMRKMNAASLAHLVISAVQLGLITLKH